MGICVILGLEEKQNLSECGVNLMADDFVKAIKMEYPERIPVGVSFLPAMWLRKREDAERLVREYPMFFFGKYT